MYIFLNGLRDTDGKGNVPTANVQTKKPELKLEIHFSSRNRH